VLDLIGTLRTHQVCGLSKSCCRFVKTLTSATATTSEVAGDSVKQTAICLDTSILTNGQWPILIGLISRGTNVYTKRRCPIFTSWNHCMFRFFYVAVVLAL
jgi:hypothetical protein